MILRTYALYHRNVHSRIILHSCFVRKLPTYHSQAYCTHQYIVCCLLYGWTRHRSEGRYVRHISWHRVVCPVWVKSMVFIDLFISSKKSRVAYMWHQRLTRQFSICACYHIIDNIRCPCLHSHSISDLAYFEDRPAEPFSSLHTIFQRRWGPTFFRRSIVGTHHCVGCIYFMWELSIRWNRELKPLHRVMIAANIISLVCFFVRANQCRPRRSLKEMLIDFPGPIIHWTNGVKYCHWTSVRV